MLEIPFEACIVYCGDLSEGLRFIGVFENEIEAQKYIDTQVHTSIQASWAYLEPINNDDPEACLMCNTKENCDCEDKVVSFKKAIKEKEPVPAANLIFNENGRLIGEQTVIPGA